jgi:hypothetical protein
MSAMTAWLAALDAAPLECDGFSRVVSVLLDREEIAHVVSFGRVEMAGAKLRGYGVLEQDAARAPDLFHILSGMPLAQFPLLKAPRSKTRCLPGSRPV